MALPVPVDASKVIDSIEDRTWRTQIESADGQAYTLTFFRQNLARNAAGEKIGVERTDEFTITLQQLQAMAANHPELQRYFAIPALIKGLCDDVATIIRQEQLDEIATAEALAALQTDESLG